MKKVLVLVLAILSLAACKKVTPEQRIADISRYFDGKTEEYTSNLKQYQGEKQIDYLHLVLAKDLGAEEIWTLDEGDRHSLIAEFPAKDADAPLAMISAPLDDPAACAAILEVLEAFHSLKIQNRNTMRALFYAPADSTGRNGLADMNEELHAAEEINLFDLELSTCGAVPPHTFAIVDTPTFAQRLTEAMPPYFAPLGDYQFVQQPFDPEWPMKGTIYRYDLSPAEFQKDAAAVTVFVYLLN